MGVYPQHEKHQYLATILHAMHFKMDVFMYNLVHRGVYEMLLYKWITKLYTKDKTVEEALQLIYKARNILLLTPTKRRYCLLILSC